MPNWSKLPQALCLVLFPLSFLLLSNTGLHPGYAGTASEQIQGLAADADRWRWVHLGMAGGSLFGVGVLLTLRASLPGSPIIGNVVTAFGVVAAAMLTGIFAMEATLVSELAKACAESRASCLTPANQAFTERFADLALNRVPLLFQSGGILMAAIAALAFIGLRLRALLVREAVPVMFGAIGVFLYGPALHGPPLGIPFVSFLILLAGSGALALRLLRSA